MKTLNTVKILFLALVFTSACGKNKSSDIGTSDFYSTFQVIGNNLGLTTCFAQFQKGNENGSSIELVEFDHVECDGKAMKKDESFGTVTYSIDVPYQADRAYEIVFTRSADEIYKSKVSIPIVIQNIQPAQGHETKKGLPLKATWARSANQTDTATVVLIVSANGKNYEFSSNQISDLGSYEFSGGQTKPALGTGAWNSILKIQRIRMGEMAVGLKGRTAATQSAALSVSIVD